MIGWNVSMNRPGTGPPIAARSRRGSGIIGAGTPAPPARIVSMLASGTELLCALGLGDKLVGRSHECDYPAWVRRLPAVSRAAVDISGSSRQIDELVRARLREGEPLYVVDEALLLELAP